MSDEIKQLKEEEKETTIYIEDDDVLTLDTNDEKSISIQEDEEERNNKWLGGAVLIAIGFVFLLQNVTSFAFDNWWALFILIPGVGSLINAWQNYHEDGRFSERARGPFVGGLILMFISAIFLFNLDWGNVWPVFLIIAGFGTLLKGWLD